MFHGMATKATLYRMVTDDHVCPFGLKARGLLERRDFELEDVPLRSREETDAFQRQHDVDTTPQVFLDGERIGGYEALREHLGLGPEREWAGSYQPVVALFATTFLMALATAPTGAGTGGFLLGLLEQFVAFSMCVLAIMKLRDLSSFRNQFLTYDLLAQRDVRYATVYPLAEGLAGVGMLAGVWTPLVGLTALTIGTIGAVSVFKAVYLDGRELHCACVGGNSEVPLGFVSLTENLMMLGMGLWMLVR